MIGTFLPEVPEINVIKEHNKINIFTQLEQPNSFNGIWIQTDKPRQKIITDTAYWLDGDFDKNSNLIQDFHDKFIELCRVYSGYLQGYSYSIHTPYLFYYNNQIYLFFCKDQAADGQNDWKSYLFKVNMDQDNESVSFENVKGGTTHIFSHNNNVNQPMLFDNFLYVFNTGIGSSQYDRQNHVYIDLRDFSYHELTNFSSSSYKSGSNFFVMNNTLFAYNSDQKAINKIINFDPTNPTGITVNNFKALTFGNTSLKTKIQNLSNLFLYNNRILMINTSECNTIKEIIFDDEMETITDIIDAYDLGNDWNSNQTTGVKIIDNFFFQYYISSFTNTDDNTIKYRIYDLEKSQLIESGLMMDVALPRYSSNNTDTNHYTIFYENELSLMKYPLTNDILGVFSAGGVLRYALESTQYDSDCIVVINKSDPIKGRYKTELVVLDEIQDYNNGTHIMLFSFDDIMYYHDGFLDSTLPTYYGDGTQWIKIKN